MKIKKVCRLIVSLALDAAARICSVFAGLPPDLWLISERGFDARDNGYCFYKYLVEKHPEIRAVYAITPDSPDLERVRALGEWVAFGSFRHRVCMYGAQALISTHDCGFTPDMVLYHHRRKHGLFRPRGKIVLLQHGVLHTVIDWYSRAECTPDLLITSTEAEARMLTERLGQPECVVRLTGMPRFDALDGSAAEKLILLMPSWRKYLVELDGRRFAESDYCRQYAGLIGDARMLRLLRENGYRLVFYPHVEMQRFYTPARRGDVSVAAADSADVQDLLRRCELLITDYSSVLFDAAYMGKAILFFQFDKDRFETEHYSKSLLDYSEFGEVCTTREALLDALSAAITEKARDRDDRRDCFKYHDRHNCDRVFEAIRELLR